jgi:hypothetical protein
LLSYSIFGEADSTVTFYCPNLGLVCFSSIILELEFTNGVVLDDLLLNDLLGGGVASTYCSRFDAELVFKSFSKRVSALVYALELRFFSEPPLTKSGLDFLAFLELVLHLDSLISG